MKSQLTMLVFLAVWSVTSLAQDGASFFPPGLFDEDPDGDRAAADVSARYLRVAGEEPLCDPAPEGEIYRLLWLPSFDPGIVVRITRGPEEVTLHIGEFTDVAPSDGVTVRTIVVTRADWERFRQEVTASGFWDDLENDPVPEGIIVLDGSRWILEGIKDGRYRALQRHLPDPERPGDREFLKPALALLELAGVDLEEREIY